MGIHGISPASDGEKNHGIKSFLLILDDSGSIYDG